jgi:hypothetical protein
MKDSPYRRAIAARLKQAFDESAMTLADLSERLGPLDVEQAPATIQRYTAGASEPSAGWIAAVAPILGVRVEWLLSGHGPLRVSPSSEAQRTTTQSRLRDELIAMAPAYFSEEDRLRFGKLVRRAMRSCELDEAKARTLVTKMVAGQVAEVAASLKLPGSPEVCLRRFVTTGQPSTSSSFPEVAHAAEYVTFALNAATRAIPEEPRERAELPAAAKARKPRKPRRSG